MSASYADDIFLVSATNRDLEAMIRDTTKEPEAVELGLGANKTHWSSYPAKTWTDFARRHRPYTVGKSFGVCGYGTGLEPITVGIDQTQTESRDNIHAKVGTFLQLNVCKWMKKDTFDYYVSVGKRPVVKCVMDVDRDNEKCDRQLECAHHLRNTGCQERRWISGGEDSIELDTLLSRVVISHCQTWLRDSFTDGEDTLRASDEPLACRSGQSKSCSVLVMGAAAPHRQGDRSPPREIQNLTVGSVVPLAQRRVHEESLGEHTVVERRPRPSLLAVSGTVGLV